MDEERKDEFKYLVENPDGSVCAKLPLKWIKISPTKRNSRIYTEEEKRKAAQAKEHIRKRKAKEKKNEQSQAQKWAFSRKKQAKKPQSHPYSRERTQEVIDALKSGQNLKEHDAIKKAKKTRKEVKKNIYDYAQEIKSTGSKVDKKLASELEKMEQQYKSVKSAQQSILDRARERLNKSKNKEKEL